ncbi:MAG TPA: Crp/Fnr family transcriptional regulator [Magnetospirillum sp.]|jgi:CRP-like cAMP-binding protein|nr:Crp/Fnr family transcriptional regulator [Magnetospirillum sp.]
MIAIMSDALLSLFNTLKPSRRTLRAGEVLFRTGEPTTALFHVEQGQVKLSRLGVPLHTAEAGSSFGEWALFAETCPCDAVAETEAEVLAFAKTPALLLLKAHPDINLAFSAYLTRQLHRMRGRLELVRQKGARERVLGYLVRAGAGDATVTLDRTLTEIAHDIGLTREAVYRTLAKLEKDGVLERQGTRTFRLK